MYIVMISVKVVMFVTDYFGMELTQTLQPRLMNLAIASFCFEVLS